MEVYNYVRLRGCSVMLLQNYQGYTENSKKKTTQQQQATYLPQA